MTNERPENVWATTLPNGLRVRVLCKPDFQRSYAVFATCYGGADRRFRVGDTWTDTPAGVAHYLEHKLFDMPDGSDALLTLSENGADPNAFTSTNMTAYYFSCTDGFEENLRTLLRFVSTPYFTDASVAKEQGIIAQEIRMGEDDPDRAVWRNLMRCLMARDGARDAVAGTVESIAEITPETLYACHRAFYAPSNMVLCAVCQDTPERVAAIAAEILPPERAPVPAADHGEPEDMSPANARMRVELAVSAPQMLLGAKFRPAEKGTARLRQTLTAELALQAAFGEATLRCAIEAGLTVKIKAPTPEAPSMVKAIDIYIDQVHAGKEVEAAQFVEDKQKEEFIRSQQHKLAKKSRARRSSADKK